MGKKIKVISISVMVLVFLISGYFVYVKKFKNQPTISTDRYIPQVVTKQDISVTIKSTGVVFAGTTKEVVAKNSGEVKNLSIKVKDTVKKGQTLLTVYNEQINSQISSAQINLEKLKLQLNNAKTEDEIKLINLQIEDAENNLANLKEQKSDMNIKSPIDGVITSINVNNGDNIQSGKTVMTIVDPKSLKIKASIDELDIAKINIGQKVKIKINALDDKIFEGKVEEISDIGTTQNNVTNYDVIISIINPEGIKIGMTASIEIEAQSKKDALVIPIEALTEINDKKYALVSNQSTDTRNIQQENTEQQRRNTRAQFGGIQSDFKLLEVKTGLRNDSFVEILEGLNEGDRVYVKISTSSSSSNNRNNMMRMPGMDMPGGNFNRNPQR